MECQAQQSSLLFSMVRLRRTAKDVVMIVWFDDVMHWRIDRTPPSDSAITSRFESSKASELKKEKYSGGSTIIKTEIAHTPKDLIEERVLSVVGWVKTRYDLNEK